MNIQKQILYVSIIIILFCSSIYVEDGTAYFRDVQFPYEVGLDFVLRPRSEKNNNKRDYFQNSKSRELFEYEIKDGVMYIYRTSGQEALDVEPEPFLKIKRTNRGADLIF